ncbi:Hypothetical_protein [Hexamita inflata]|uniref:Hypothetical_protein n=1 Tax=Hexamita inflata TaxID=28002 RepID=A0AA86RDB6_9EUKA|nr:Hypothetical protein HINF_LOCUS61902 [Hexamita inflata]
MTTLEDGRHEAPRGVEEVRRHAGGNTRREEDGHQKLETKAERARDRSGCRFAGTEERPRVSNRGGNGESGGDGMVFQGVERLELGRWSLRRSTEEEAAARRSWLEGAVDVAHLKEQSGKERGWNQ